MSCTLSLNVAVLNSGRGSRPGFSSSARMSLTVGMPNCASAKSSARSARSTGSRPISSRTGIPVRATIRSTTG